MDLTIIHINILRYALKMRLNYIPSRPTMIHEAKLSFAIAV